MNLIMGLFLYIVCYIYIANMYSAGCVMIAAIGGSTVGN